MTHLSPKQAAQALGVSESSVKRWCDLGAVPVVRTAGGHRRIPLESLEKWLALGGGAEPVAQGALVPDALVPGALAPGALPSGVSGGGEEPPVETFETLADRVLTFRNALQLGQEARCRRLLQGLIDTGYTRTVAADALITKAMHQFGDLWEQGELAVYQERRAVGICLGLLHELRQSIQLSSDAPLAMGGAPRGDVYQLASQLVELALCERGWRATSLGCNLPIASIAQAYRDYRPRLLWMSLSVVEDEEGLVREFNELAELVSPETTLLIGGRAASDSLRPRLRYTAHCDCLEQMGILAAALHH
ncbi:MAG: helix-turn-helix domain-containing protein [Planctomycetaceae bacterium]